VYPTWIDLKKITRLEAEHRMSVLVDLVEDMYQLYPSLRPAATGSLFGPDFAQPRPPQHLDRP
jgi:hypothetical protein